MLVSIIVEMVEGNGVTERIQVRETIIGYGLAQNVFDVNGPENVNTIRGDTVNLDFTMRDEGKQRLFVRLKILWNMKGVKSVQLNIT